MDDTMTMELTRELLQDLGAAFPDDEVEFLPRGNWEGKARALAYIDARSVMRRLDAVVGSANWSFDFDLLSPEGKMVKGKLTVLGVTKCDAGEGASEDEVLKSAVSDALKRCAVHFNIGRYLYYLPSVWCPYDQRKRQFSETPRIPPAAIEKALATCGISTTNLPLQREQAPHPNPATQRPGGGQQNSPQGERKSIWNTSGNREGAPESSGDRSAAQPPPRAEEAVRGGEKQPTFGQAPGAQSGPPSTAPAEGLVCSTADCGRPLTRGQHEVSLRAWGRSLCPSCQKQQARQGA